MKIIIEATDADINRLKVSLKRLGKSFDKKFNKDPRLMQAIREIMGVFFERKMPPSPKVASSKKAKAKAKANVAN